MSDDPAVLGVYVKQPGWIQVNRAGTEAMSIAEKRAIVESAVGGGAYAYFNREAKFGVEQRFDPQEFIAMGLFWNGSRRQINLELLSKVVSLEKGQTSGYAYEVRYLEEAPQTQH
jgi:hypothetical protein